MSVGYRRRPGDDDMGERVLQLHAVRQSNGVRRELSLWRVRRSFARSQAHLHVDHRAESFLRQPFPGRRLDERRQPQRLLYSLRYDFNACVVFDSNLEEGRGPPLLNRWNYALFDKWNKLSSLIL